jgi:prepilin-type N-terminal cleavage/methylation domain-containing protein
MNRFRRIRSDEGFTLIELLIVIVILGILAAIVVFAVNGITDRGTLSACKADAASITTAAEAYYAQSTPGGYPTTIGGLVTAGLLHANSNITTGTGATETTPNYTITYTTNGTTSPVVTSSLSGCP